jgi:hypothetical protein
MRVSLTHCLLFPGHIICNGRFQPGFEKLFLGRSVILVIEIASGSETETDWQTSADNSSKSSEIREANGKGLSLRAHLAKSM